MASWGPVTKLRLSRARQNERPSPDSVQHQAAKRDDGFIMAAGRASNGRWLSTQAIIISKFRELLDTSRAAPTTGRDHAFLIPVFGKFQELAISSLRYCTYSSYSASSRAISR